MPTDGATIYIPLRAATDDWNWAAWCNRAMTAVRRGEPHESGMTHSAEAVLAEGLDHHAETAHSFLEWMLGKFLDDPNETLAETLLFCLSHMTDRLDAGRLLAMARVALKSGNFYARAMVCNVVEHLDLPEGYLLLREHLASERNNFVRSCIIALIDDPGAGGSVGQFT